jgi:predicted small secreted protein
MPTLMQKLRLALRGWNRRRDEAKKEFVAKNASWARGGQALMPVAPKSTSTIDIDGLTVAYLDDSGHFAHYLDTDTGDIIDVANDEAREAPRYRRIPQRTAQSESADRRAFVDGLQPSRGRDELARAIGVPEAFRRALSNDRALERAWYSFKNDRAIAAIEAWLRGEALK